MDVPSSQTRSIDMLIQYRGVLWEGVGHSESLEADIAVAVITLVCAVPDINAATADTGVKAS